MKKTVRIIQDDSAESPREWDNLGTMVCWHRKYLLGDKQPSEDPIEYMRTLTQRYFRRDISDMKQSVLEKHFNHHYVVLPLYLYDHSGITMNTTGFSCKWDSGQVGFIYVSLEKIRAEHSVHKVSKKMRDKVAGYLKNEVEVYDQYLTGDVYGFICEDNGVEQDSCWSFYGSDPTKNGMIEHISDFEEREVIYE